MNTDILYAKSIACDYAPKSSRKVIALKKLDRYAKKKAHIIAYTFGGFMMLISSIGMYLSMRAMFYGSRIDIATGIVIVMIGIIGMGMNLPIYKKLLERSKQKYAFDIIELAKQICEAEE